MNDDKFSNIIVIKRSGKRVPFNGMKIAIAIKNGFDSVEGKYNEDDANSVYNRVINRILDENLEKLKIEQIQDFIEDELIKSGYDDVYKSFSAYREKRNQSRELFFEEKRKHKFLKALEKLGLDSKDNGEVNFNGKNAYENMIEYGKAVSEEFASAYLIKKKFSEAHENGEIYIKKIESYSTGTTENMQIDLEKLFKDGFSTKNCSMREPQSISSYGTLAIVAISSNQKDQNSEQSIPAFDYYMANGVLKTFIKEFRQTVHDFLEYTDFDKFIALNGIDREINKISTIGFNVEDFYKFTRGSEELKRMFRIAYDKAMNKTNSMVYQAMEGFLHDINSLCNDTITTINIGTDTSKEGRMVIKNLLRTTEEGIGENKEAISPKIVFKIKDGVNFKKGDPNYDLFEKACEIAVETNNICFSFLDTSYNSPFYKEGDFNTEVAYFSDGTRVIDNFVDEDKQVSNGRGVVSSVVINLPRIALKHLQNYGDSDEEQQEQKLDAFYKDLEDKMEFAKDELLERMEMQGNKNGSNFPFLMGQDVWIDSERIKPDDKVKKVLKQGLLEIGFTGLNEALNLLLAENVNDAKDSKKDDDNKDNDNDKYNKLGENNNLKLKKGIKLENEREQIGVEIVSKMRKMADEFSKRYNLNFVLCANYDDEINRAFLEFDRTIYGKIEGVTDKSKYSSGFSVDIIDKNKDSVEQEISIQAPFFELTNGGHKFNLFTKKVSSNNEKTISSESQKLQNNLKEIYKSDIGFVDIVHSEPQCQ